jgi:hypothetical protein
MTHDVSPQPLTPMEANALELTTALREAFHAWVDQKAPEGEEIFIATEVLLKGIFGFAAPTIVGTLTLRERGAETVAKQFAQALADAIQRRQRATPGMRKRAN